MSFDEFITKWNNQPVDFDGIYPNQCMDLMHQYVYDVFGITDKSVLAAPAAYQVFANFSWDSLFEKIDNSPSGVPQKGDLVFWGTTIGAYGHVAIFIEGNADSFKSFDANWPTGSLPHTQDHSYNGVLGWLRPKISTSDPLVCDPASKRDEYIGKAAKYEDYVKAGYNTVQEVTDQVNSLKSTIDDLNKQIGSKQKDLDDRQAAINTLNLKVESLSTTMAQDAINDHDQGVKLSDAEHQRDIALNLLQSHYKQVNSANEQTYTQAIAALQAPHAEVVKQVQPVIEGLADAAILKKVTPKQKTSIIQGFLDWLNS